MAVSKLVVRENWFVNGSRYILLITVC